MTQHRQKLARTHPVQAKGIQKKGPDSTEAVHQAAESGLSGGGGGLPFADRIQDSFGAFDVSGIRAHTGGAAQQANETMGSTAYATGRDIAFRGGPDLFTAAHEAAHVIQQQAGVQLRGGVGEAGDRYEQHADAVAARVVQGQSAEDLLSQFTGGGNRVQRRAALQKRGHSGRAVQHDPASVAGAVIAAAAFAAQVAPQTSAGLSHTNVLTRYVRDNAQDASTANVRPRNLDVLQLYTNMAASSAQAGFRLVLRTDGDNIFAANTELASRDGFAGGVIGSTGSAIWSAIPYSGPREQPTSILLTCQGHCDPSGPGFADYRLSMIVKGDGTVVRQGASVMDVSGNLRKTMAVVTWGSGYMVRSMLHADAAGNQEQPAEG